MARTYVILSDVQAPYHDKAALKAVTRFIGEFQPDEVVQIGDLLDLPQPARWSKDTRAEFEGSVFTDSAYTKANILKPIREVFDGPFKILEGNHDLRAREYLAKYAPALDKTDAFNFETLLDFDGFGIEKAPDFYEFAPGWIMTHGHLGKISLSQVAGATAANAARKMGTSVIMGHTHRLGAISHTTGYGGDITQTVTGVEVGNLMDMTQAHYLKGGTANWQKGFAIARTEKGHTQVDLIQIKSKKFMVDGVLYAV